LRATRKAVVGKKYVADKNGNEYEKSWVMDAANDPFAVKK
jgi:hypothetical protein